MIDFGSFTLHVSGMTGDCCQTHVREALESVPGVRAARVDVARGMATIHFSAHPVEPRVLNHAVRRLGYGARSAGPPATAPYVG